MVHGSSLCCTCYLPSSWPALCFIASGVEAKFSRSHGPPWERTAGDAPRRGLAPEWGRRTAAERRRQCVPTEDRGNEKTGLKTQTRRGPFTGLTAECVGLSFRAGRPFQSTRRNARPGRAPVCLPWSSTTLPFTITYSIPTLY